MIIKHTRDTLSETYLDAVAIRNTVFVKGQGVPLALSRLMGTKPTVFTLSYMMTKAKLQQPYAYCQIKT